MKIALFLTIFCLFYSQVYSQNSIIVTLLSYDNITTSTQKISVSGPTITVPAGTQINLNFNFTVTCESDCPGFFYYAFYKNSTIIQKSSFHTTPTDPPVTDAINLTSLNDGDIIFIVASNSNLTQNFCPDCYTFGDFPPEYGTPTQVIKILIGSSGTTTPPVTGNGAICCTQCIQEGTIPATLTGASNGASQYVWETSPTGGDPYTFLATGLSYTFSTPPSKTIFYRRAENFSGSATIYEQPIKITVLVNATYSTPATPYPPNSIFKVTGALSMNGTQTTSSGGSAIFYSPFIAVSAPAILSPGIQLIGTQSLCANLPNGRSGSSETNDSIQSASKGLAYTIFFKDQFQRLSIYPNPAKGEVNITYSVGERSHVTLQVLDLLGRGRMLINENKEPGNYTTMIPSKEFGIGISTCILTTGSARQMQKVIVLE